MICIFMYMIFCIYVHIGGLHISAYLNLLCIYNAHILFTYFLK